MLANQATYREMAGQFLAGYPFIYFSGMLALVAGLTILNAHHAWTRDWRSVDHRARLDHDGRRRVPHHRAAVRQLRRHGGSCAQRHFFTGAGIVLLALGGFLTFKGYAA